MEERINAANREAARQRIITRARRFVRLCDKMIHAGEWWAANGTDQSPVDVEDFRVMRHYALKVLREMGEESGQSSVGSGQ